MKNKIKALVLIVFSMLMLTCQAQDEIKHKWDVDTSNLTLMTYTDSIANTKHPIYIDSQLVGHMQELSKWMHAYKVDFSRLKDLEGVYIVKNMPPTRLVGEYVPRKDSLDNVYISNKILFVSSQRIVLFHEMFHFMVEGASYKGSVHCDEPECPTIINRHLNGKMPYIYKNYADEMENLMYSILSYQNYIRENGN